ncbi:hypothetical protein AB0L40_20045 [Patulibacter sp. NPDC049589]|uniref:hypothetical protein n=1 Tax=Patulibacter sp. NPDC049589 TaxID=3154731 RepID=UPI00342FE04A
MSPLFPRFAGELAEAAEARARPRRRLHLPIVGASVVVVVAAGGIATAATGVWSPQLGDARRGSPTASATGVPDEQLARLAVLRRPATAGDHGAEVRRALTFISPQGIRGIRTDAVRLLAPAPAGARTAGAEVLIPAQRANGISDALCLFTVDPTEGGGVGCYSTRQVLEGQAVGSMQRNATPTRTERAKRQRLMRRAMRENARRRAIVRRRVAPTLPRGRQARILALRRAYLDAGLLAITVPLRDRTVEAVYSGIVPDGVARVVRRDAGREHVGVVENNLFRITVPGARQGPGTLVWQDADGRVLRTIAPGG